MFCANLRDARLSLAQTEKGKQQALGAGQAIRAMMEQDGNPYNLFFYTSPYKRSRQTFEEIGKAIDPEAIIGAQEEVQLREQDFGNFQARRLPLCLTNAPCPVSSICAVLSAIKDNGWQHCDRLLRQHPLDVRFRACIYRHYCPQSPQEVHYIPRGVERPIRSRSFCSA